MSLARTGSWVITGASRGIGRAAAIAFAEPGRRFVLTATKRENLDATVAALEMRGASAVALAFDQGRDDPACLVDALGGAPLGGLLNNAAGLWRGTLEETTDGAISRALEVNVAGLMRVTRALSPRLERGSRVLNVGSISGTLGTPGASLYNATKWAVTGLTKSWAEEWRGRGIFVGEVRPGSVDTDMLRQTPFPPAMQPEDVARLLRFLAFEAPLAMSGSAVDIFG